jgi:hypothetical protein
MGKIQAVPRSVGRYPAGRRQELVLAGSRVRFGSQRHFAKSSGLRLDHKPSFRLINLAFAPEPHGGRAGSAVGLASSFEKRRDADAEVVQVSDSRVLLGFQLRTETMALSNAERQRTSEAARSIGVEPFGARGEHGP